MVALNIIFCSVGLLLILLRLMIYNLVQSVVYISIEYQPDLVPVWCYPELSSLQYEVMPVYRTIQHFSQHKANDKELYTDPFYTSKRGYKVTLRVVPNGHKSAKGTHVSVYMHLMKGANDNNLQFPMTGIFSVQVMNWKGDNQHFQKPIVFDDYTPVERRERVVTDKRGKGSGKRHFMLHNELTRYLHEDKMCFKILHEPLPPQTGYHYNIHFVNFIDHKLHVSEILSQLVWIIKEAHSFPFSCQLVQYIFTIN